MAFPSKASITKHDDYGWFVFSHEMFKMGGYLHPSCRWYPYCGPHGYHRSPEAALLVLDAYRWRNRHKDPRRVSERSGG